MKNFHTWFDEKLKVTRYPLPNEIKKLGVEYVINVSCEYIASNQQICINNNIKYFWFPMDELSKDIGINSIFGALQILWIAEQENAKVILHCHAGANRSPTVRDAYYFMRTKTHLIKEKTKENKILHKNLFGSDGGNFDTNMLKENIKNYHLPQNFESFLLKTQEWFLKQDWENDFKTESGLISIKLECEL